MKRALITGITGQDGHFLTKLLLSKNYEIHGIVTDQNSERTQKFSAQFPEIKLHQGTLASGDSLIPILEISQPEEIYHLGGISFVGKSFSHPELISNVTGLGTLRLLESIRTVLSGLKVKIYNASSSEIFGTPQEEYQHENSRHNPSSPYGVAKTFGFLSCANYRDTYSMFVSS